MQFHFGTTVAEQIVKNGIIGWQVLPSTHFGKGLLMETGNAIKYVATCCVAAVIGLVAFVGYEARVLTYLSGDPKVCINCHTMNTQYATWQHNSHRDRAGCVDCHLPQDSFFEMVIAKARDGYNHSLAMTLGTYGNSLRISSNAGARIQANCISCHQQLVSQMLANSELYPQQGKLPMERPCWECHRGVPHGTTKGLLATQGNLGVKEL